MAALRKHVTFNSPDVPRVGSRAVFNLAISSPANKAKLVAAGANVVLQAIVSRPSSSADAKKRAKDALGQLMQGLLFGWW